MGSKKARTAHDILQPAVRGNVERIRAAADRVVSDRADEEAVHDFRVGLRRLRTVLRSSRGIYGKKRIKALESSFKRFGDATNALRDAEVLAETLALVELDPPHREVATRWLAEERRRQERLRDDAMATIEGGELEEAFAALLDVTGGRPKTDLSMKRFAKTRLVDVQAGVAQMLPVSREDVAALHRLRIRFKRLRYTAEMLDRFTSVGQRRKKSSGSNDASAGGSRRSSFAKIAKQAQRMQKLLGTLHDADVALETVATSEMLTEEERLALRRGLTALRQRLVDESVDAVEALPSYVLGD